MSDLIAAISTPLSPSAIGILRLSGPGAAAAADRVFHARSGRPLAEAPSRHSGVRLPSGPGGAGGGSGVGYGLPRAAQLYRGGHGGAPVPRLAHGALPGTGGPLRRGGPSGARGEFTKRAFLNGRLDLPQAEAVADLLEAETPEGVRAAAGQLSGALSRRVEGVYHGLVDLLAHFHAVLDYPDEDIGPLEAEQIGGVLSAAAGELRRLLETYQRGRFLVRGAPCAIVGLPNAGKSSLLNALVGYQRAIVTDIPGTTRDTVEERCMLGGVLLRLIDTAGLRETDDPVERLGVARSRAALEGAELALVLMDGSAPAEDLDRLTAELQLWEEAARTCPRTILVLTKADLPRGADRGFSVLGGEKAPPVVRLSAGPGRDWRSCPTPSRPSFPRAPPGRRAPFSPTPGRRRPRSGPCAAWSARGRAWTPASPRTRSSPMWRGPWRPWESSPGGTFGRMWWRASSPGSVWESKELWRPCGAA